jgi:hypothetical protein
MNKYLIALIGVCAVYAPAQAHRYMRPAFYYDYYRPVVYRTPHVYCEEPVVYQEYVEEVPVMVRRVRPRPVYRRYHHYHPRPYRAYGPAFSFSFGF